MADWTGKDEEMEHRVHIATMMKWIEQGTGDVANTFGNDPDNGSRADAIE